MTRRFADPVEVRRSVRDGEPVPATFLWRGRLYVVRNILGHWWERRAWWSGAAGRAVLGEGAVPAEPGSTVADREVWRVEASPGRSFGTGVYDLCATPAAGAASGVPTSGWQLIRVVD